ncbi:hypothetical protein C7B80_19830 [Cyanosarcina cf. burmensis CCALA 770]|nr:hypothetical protein C7B80_19830 [Cyanosarcina cf. burmensis CCALA 770]
MMKITVISQIAIALVSLSTVFTPTAAKAQLIPQPWVSVGGDDGDVTFSVGARIIGLGVELGFGPGDSTGVDVLKFINLPVVDPYIGVGYYSDDEDFAVSGGVQIDAVDNLFVGVGYNSVRGFNGQVGVKF